MKEYVIAKIFDNQNFVQKQNPYRFLLNWVTGFVKSLSIYECTVHREMIIHTKKVR